ncbi:MAG: cupin domain-containing protein [Woeseiaceae bacterium]|jgi:uncharacterized cupin superfamily protein|nr:DUF861 domain-containing protein [Woeseiaceae bacterium]MDG1015883.1 cupin domain-containing protein [Woeseiaceae bacterium]MDG1713124.1 cupin domain-containing protein [Woeseiaceae bacterium]MDG1864858.1 cupin domain-containing protein [Woeseiaceae bacterium]|tara:strand:+ start:86 stop:529 length:444 start_codon:yes stop_codon:yes gene_type:complete
MNKLITILVSTIIFVGTAYADHHNEVIKPSQMTKSDIAGAIYERSDMTKSTTNGNTTLDVTDMLSSDGKFETGMFRSGATKMVIDEPYGVDEIFYIIEGSITLTSADGSVLTSGAGETLSIPKEWTGIWETDGYSKIWAIYYGESKD